MERNRGFEFVESRRIDGEVYLPLRGTKTSAGYDFFTPVDLVIKPQDKVFFWTDVKSYMHEGEVLLLDIRSSMGVNQDLMMANTIPVIDSDYHNSKKTEGNIGICIRNLKPEMRLLGTEPYEVTFEGGEVVLLNIPNIKDLREENTVYIKAGERVAQGIFLEFKESDNCNTDEERTGGFGSSGK